MLNKNQSSKWNSWKYLLIVPALAAFLFYFQVKVVAQQRDIAPLYVAAQEGVIEVVVDKNTSDAELKNEAERLKKEHGIKLKFSKVKRNSNGEITSIKAEFKDANGKKGTTMVSGDKPIDPIRFYKEYDGAIGFGGHDNARFVHRIAQGHPGVRVFTHTPADVHFEMPELAEMPEAEDFNFDFDFDLDSLDGENHKVIISTKNGDKRTVIVNGKELTGEEADKVIAKMGSPLKIRTHASATDGEGEDVFISVNGDKIFSSEDVRVISSKAATEARRAMAAAKPEMARAKIEMKRAAADMKRAQKELAAEQKLLDKEISVKGYKRNEEMEQARKEMEAAREDMKKVREELRQMREELAKERASKK